MKIQIMFGINCCGCTETVLQPVFILNANFLKLSNSKNIPNWNLISGCFRALFNETFRKYWVFIYVYLCIFDTGDIPLHVNIRETCDSGQPIVISQPQSDAVSLVH